MLDEASQLSTADLAMIGEAARQAGARIIATGDTAQLGAVEAGGMFRLLAREVPAAQLHEVRRFDAAWERQASVRLRDGDLAAVAAYDRHGRIRGADEEAAYDRAASMWLADHLRGKDVLLLAGSNAEAAELSRRVQARLTQMGSVGPPQAALSDGNQAGVGDLVRARLNTEIDAGGRQLTNRDTLQFTAFRGPDAEVRRQRLDGTWTGTFRVPRSYLARHAELAYAGNVHVAQGRTVDTAHLLVTESLSRQALYVGMTRGREANTAHVVTGKTAPPGHEPYQQAAPESVLAGVLGRDAGGPVRHRADPPGPGMGRRNRPPAQPVVRRRQASPVPGHRRADQGQAHRIRSLAVRAGALPQGPAAAAPRRPARRARHRRGHRPDHRRADGPGPVHLQRPARPPAAARPARPAATTRHGRSAHPPAPPPVAHELAAELDDRVRALGERMAAAPEPWLARQLGVARPRRVPRAARGIHPPRRPGRRLPRSRRDHQP